MQFTFSRVLRFCRHSGLLLHGSLSPACVPAGVFHQDGFGSFSSGLHLLALEAFAA